MQFNPMTEPQDGLPRLSTREYFAIHFATSLVQVIRKNQKDQVICNMGAACDMADALIENLQAPRIKEPDVKPPQ